MSMNTKKNISIVLLVLALLLWLLRKMNVLYIPGLSMVLLGLVHDHGGYHDVPGEAEKEAGRHADPGLRPVLHRNGRDGDQGLFCVRNKKGSTRPGAPLSRSPVLPQRAPIPIFCQILPFSIPGNRKKYVKFP